MAKEEKKLKIKDDICAYLKDGMRKKDAALIAGISEKTFYRWIAEDDSFDSRVELSILKYKRSLIVNLNTCAEKNGMTGLKILEKRWPEEWGKNRKTERERKDEASSKNVADLFLKILRKDSHKEGTLPEVS